MCHSFKGFDFTNVAFIGTKNSTNQCFNRFRCEEITNHKSTNYWSCIAIRISRSVVPKNTKRPKVELLLGFMQHFNYLAAKWMGVSFLFVALPSRRMDYL
jgi:hypothetical protein